jgi:5-oxoprolinase (ATP-hydrolysing) subunit A
MKVDINCDMGESPEAVEDGTQEALMEHITSVNIACGGHAGDEQTMRLTVAQARRHSLAIGAHPGYPDRVHFGRMDLDMPLEAVEQTVYDQIRALATIATEIVHVKPHGALYNQAVTDPALAAAIARGTARFSRDVLLVGLADSRMLDVFRDHGFRAIAEAFADRRYEADGTLRSRRFADALIQDPQDAAAQAVSIWKSGRAQSICIHSDTPGAVSIAAAVARALRVDEGG